MVRSSLPRLPRLDTATMAASKKVFHQSSATIDQAAKPLQMPEFADAQDSQKHFAATQGGPSIVRPAASSPVRATAKQVRHDPSAVRTTAELEQHNINKQASCPECRARRKSRHKNLDYLSRNALMEPPVAPTQADLESEWKRTFSLEKQYLNEKIQRLQNDKAKYKTQWLDTRRDMQKALEQSSIQATYYRDLREDLIEARAAVSGLKKCHRDEIHEIRIETNRLYQEKHELRQELDRVREECNKAKEFASNFRGDYDAMQQDLVEICNESKAARKRVHDLEDYLFHRLPGALDEVELKYKTRCNEDKVLRIRG